MVEIPPAVKNSVPFLRLGIKVELVAGIEVGDIDEFELASSVRIVALEQMQNQACQYLEKSRHPLLGVNYLQCTRTRDSVQWSGMYCSERIEVDNADKEVGCWEDFTASL